MFKITPRLQQADGTGAAHGGVKVASATKNKRDGSVVTAPIKPVPQLFFSPATCEVILVPPEEMASFNAEVTNLDSVMLAFINAKAESNGAYTKLIEMQAAEEISKEYARVLKKEEAARKALADEVANMNFNPGGDIFELYALSSQGSVKKYDENHKIVYARTSKNKNLFRVAMGDGQKGQMKPFLTWNADRQQWELSAQKLKQRFSAARKSENVSAAKVFSDSAKDFKNAGKDFADGKANSWTEPLIKKLTSYQIEGEKELFKIGEIWAPEFAAAFNRNANFESPDDPEAMRQFGAEATALRFFAGSSAVASGGVKTSLADLLEGKFSVHAGIKGKAEAGLMLAQGSAHFDLTLPHRRGLELGLYAMNVETGKADNWNSFGAFRLFVRAEVEGSAGASLLANSAVELQFDSNGHQKLQGKVFKSDPLLLKRQRLDIKKTQATAEAKAEFVAFAGGRAGGSLKGAFQWQKPESKEFGDFALIQPKIAGLSGIGGDAAFGIIYVEGKFRVVLQLSACAGLGLSGKIAAEIGVETIEEFAMWFQHQVIAAGGQNLQYFSKQAFESYCAIYALAIVEGKDIASFLGVTFDDARKKLELAIKRNKSRSLDAIRSSGHILLYAGAEVKGYLIKALADMAREDVDIRTKIYDAIDYIKGAIYHQAELENVYQHFTLNFGEKVDAQLARAELQALQGETMVAAADARVRAETPLGYRLLRNDSIAYDFQHGVHVAWNDNAWWANASTMVG